MRIPDFYDACKDDSMFGHWEPPLGIEEAIEEARKRNSRVSGKAAKAADAEKEPEGPDSETKAGNAERDSEGGEGQTRAGNKKKGLKDSRAETKATDVEEEAEGGKFEPPLALGAPAGEGPLMSGTLDHAVQTQGAGPEVAKDHGPGGSLPAELVSLDNLMPMFIAERNAAARLLMKDMAACADAARVRVF